MAASSNSMSNFEEIKDNVRFETFLLVLLGLMVGVLTAVLMLPSWLPGIKESLASENTTAFWYLSRGSAFSAYLLLWLSMVLGVGITNKMAALWPGLPATIDLHQFISILGLIFAGFHGLILLGDEYINFSLTQILIPFSTSYKPILTGLGQTTFYLWGIVLASFYVRKIIGKKGWRAIHFLSFAAFAAALFHGITSGTDTSTTWAQVLYWSTGISLLFMIIYRILHSTYQKTLKTNNSL